MANRNAKGIKRIINALFYSMAGFKATWQNEEAFRLEVLLCAAGVPLGFRLGATGTEQALLVGSLILVLIVELLNSAVETTVDRVGTEHHELSGRAKDIGSASVFLSIVLAVLVWVLILV